MSGLRTFVTKVKEEPKRTPDDKVMGIVDSITDLVEKLTETLGKKLDKS